MQALWWILFILSILTACFFTGFFLPRLFFRFSPLARTHDRGLKKYKQKNGRAVVCQPLDIYKKYISQYIISEKDNKKVLVCKTTERVRHISLDVVLFDCLNHSFGVISVSSEVLSDYTAPISLPENAAYTCLIVSSVNGNKIPSKTNVNSNVRKTNLIVYLSLTLLFVALEIFFIRVCLANIFGGVFVESFLSSGLYTFLAFCQSLAFSAVILLVSLVFVRIKGGKS